MPNVPLQHSTGQVALRKKILAAKSADNILATTVGDLETDEINIETNNQVEEKKRKESESYDDGILVNLDSNSPTKENAAEPVSEDTVTSISNVHSGSDSALLELQEDKLLKESKSAGDAHEDKTVEAETHSASSVYSGSTDKSRYEK